MSRTTGNTFEVYVGTNEVANVADVDLKWGAKTPVKSRSLSENEPSVIGMGSKDDPCVVTLTVERDSADTNGQAALDTAFGDGTTVTLNLYPEGKTSGNIEITGTAYVTDRGNLTGQKNNVKETTYVLEYASAPTEGTVA